MQFRVVVALLLVACVASCVEGKRWNAKVDLHDHFGPFYAQYRAQNANITVPSILNFTQWLNHFDETDQRTWTQHYVVNSDYWTGEGPIFFMINGEGPMDALSVVALQYVAWAQQFNALLVSLEHRFYGNSQPCDNISTHNLKFLSAEQALADAANFIEWFAKSNNAEDNMVITFGGSYAGMLSGWMRQKYPSLIDASIASSGPVHAEVDFYQYLEVIAASLTTLGGAECVANIAAGTQKFQSLASTPEGIETLAQTFNTCAPIAPEDLPVFFETLAGVFMGTVQYNLEFPGTNITTLCDIMTNSSGDAVSNYINLMMLASGGECMDVSYEQSIEELKNDSNYNGVGGRMWFYQTCVEFGYYQTTDSPNQPFWGFNVTSQTQQCRDVFGFDFLPGVNWTLTEFGDRDPDSSDTLWVNGSIDPWHALGVLVAPNGAEFNTLLINGTAHCADMMPPFPGAPASLVPAQAVIQNTLAGWINAKK